MAALNRDIRARFIGEDRTAAAARSAQRNVANVGRSYSSLANKISQTNRLIAGVTLSIGGGNALQTFANLQGGLSRLSAVSRTAAQDQLFLAESSQRLSVDLESQTNLLARLRVLQEAGAVSQSQAITLTEGLADAFVRFGASAGQQENVVYGLAQALGQGTVQAAELNQVVEPLPGLLNDIAAQAGMTAGEYRQLIKEGNTLSTTFRDQLLGALREYAGSAERLSQNVQQTLTRLSNAYKLTLIALAEPITAGVASIAEPMTAALTAVGNNAELIASSFSLLADAIILAIGVKAISALRNFTTAVASGVGRRITLIEAERQAYVRNERERKRVEAVEKARAGFAARTDRIQAASAAKQEKIAKRRAALLAQENLQRKQIEKTDAKNSRESAIRAQTAAQEKLGQATAERARQLDNVNRALRRSISATERTAGIRVAAEAERDAARASKTRAATALAASNSDAAVARNKERVTAATTRLAESERQVTSAIAAQRVQQENRDRLARLAGRTVSGTNDLNIQRARSAVSEQLAQRQRNLSAANTALAQAQREVTTTTAAVAAAEKKLVRASGSTVIARQAQVAAARELRTARLAHEASSRGVAAATNAQAVAQRVANIQVGLANNLARVAAAANTVHAIAVRGLTLALAGLRSVYQLLGGPAGAILIAGYAIYKFMGYLRDQDKVVRDARIEIEKLKGTYEAAGKAAVSSFNDKTTEQQLQIRIAAFEKLREGIELTDTDLVAIGRSTNSFVRGIENVARAVGGSLLDNFFPSDASINIERATQELKELREARKQAANLDAQALAGTDFSAIAQQAKDYGKTLRETASESAKAFAPLVEKEKELLAIQIQLERASKTRGIDAETLDFYERAAVAVRNELADVRGITEQRREQQRLLENIRTQTANTNFALLQDADPFAAIMVSAQNARRELEESNAKVLDPQLYETRRLSIERKLASDVAALRKRQAEDDQRAAERLRDTRLDAEREIEARRRDAASRIATAAGIINPIAGAALENREAVRQLEAERARKEISDADYRLVKRSLDIKLEQELAQIRERLGQDADAAAEKTQRELLANAKQLQSQLGSMRIGFVAVDNPLQGFADEAERLRDRLEEVRSVLSKLEFKQASDTITDNLNRQVGQFEAAAQAQVTNAQVNIYPLAGLNDQYNAELAALRERISQSATLQQNARVLELALDIEFARKRQAAISGIEADAVKEREKRRGVKPVDAFNSLYQGLAKAAEKEVGAYISLTDDMTAAERKQAKESNAINKARFEQNKKLRIAAAIVDTFAGANRALAQQGAYGFAAAAAIIATGFANVRSIRAQQFGSGAVANSSIGQGSGLGTTQGGNPNAGPDRTTATNVIIVTDGNVSPQAAADRANQLLPALSRQIRQQGVYIDGTTIRTSDATLLSL